MTTATDLANVSIAAPTARVLGAKIDGAVKSKPAIAALTSITTPDATDAATVITLANASKAKINAIIAALKA